MAISLPIAKENSLIGSCVAVAIKNKKMIFATTLHHLGNGKDIKIAVPPHHGNLNQLQPYPLQQCPSIEARVVMSEPISDLALLELTDTKTVLPTPSIVSDINELTIGEELLVIGYPYSTLGSLLETVQITHISAKGHRYFLNKPSNVELIIAHQTLQGSSGSAVVRRLDGKLCGILRGTLAPPSVLSIGNIPLATDSNVTYVTFSGALMELINDYMRS